MSEPLVSVVVVACNVDRFLSEAIESILSQTLRDFEFIIVDFGSTDNSRSIAAKYAALDDRIRFRTIPSCSLPEARNAGSCLAKGRYIAVMDADDIALPNRLELETGFMENHPEVGFLGGAVEWIDVHGHSIGIHQYPSEDQELRSILLTYCPFWHPTLMVRRDAFLAVGGYRKAFIFAHDYDLELRISDQFKCANLHQVLLKYRVHPSQVGFARQGQQTLCKLAAQFSATCRKENLPDPLNGVDGITPALLASLGVSEAAQKNALAADCRNRIRTMFTAGEYSVALEAATNLLNSDTTLIERWQIADLYTKVAELHWAQKRLRKTVLAGFHALVIRPALVGRPIRHLARRFLPVRDRREHS